MKKILGTVAVLGLASAAFAGGSPLSESEANNTPGTANFIADTFYPFGAVAIDGSLAPGDVDYFSFDLNAGDFVAAAVYDFTPDDGGDNDSLLGVFGPGGVFFDSDDDDGPGLLSAIHLFADSDGIWSIAVSGFGDSDFNGSGHDENFDYKFVFAINPIPEPASLSLLLAGAAFVLRRR